MAVGDGAVYYAPAPPALPILGESDTPRMCRPTLTVLPSAAAGFWAAVGLQRCMYDSCVFVARSQISDISSNGTVGQSYQFYKT